MYVQLVKLIVLRFIVKNMAENQLEINFRANTEGQDGKVPDKY